MTTNLFQQLKALLPEKPLLVATVSSVNGDGTSTVTLPGGGVQRVRGTSVTSGSKAFIKDGRIESAAPNLTSLVIEI